MVESRGATPGAIPSATPGATPCQRPVNGGATHTPYTPSVAPALGGGVHAFRVTAEQLVEAMKIAGGVILREVADAIFVPPEFDTALDPERFDQPNWEAVASVDATPIAAEGG